MAIIVNSVETPVGASQEEIIRAGIKKAGFCGYTHFPEEMIQTAGVYKTSLDARRRNHIHLTSSVYVQLRDETEEETICAGNPHCARLPQTPFQPEIGKKRREKPVVIAGFGPAGMFAALVLAEHGYRPIVLERGKEIDARAADVALFWKSGVLQPDSNVQFGEGGAGAFSDGKLTTRIKSPYCDYILEQFVRFGGPAELKTKAKPHIGTDLLRNIVRNMREEILRLGGKIYFQTRLTGIQKQNGRVAAVETAGTAGARETIPCQHLILAVGHSARDTFSMLLQQGVTLEPKPFSVGARIEHAQEEVNASLYGSHAGNPALPPGEYQLSHRKNGRGVYTFCMCPGGFVVPAASEPDTIVTNGMSEFARNQPNANAALVVSVTPEDFGGHPLDGVRFAQNLERKAFLLAGGDHTAPALSAGAFLKGISPGSSPVLSSGVVPSYTPGVTPANFDDLFPPFVTGMMREGLRVFGKKMACFQNPRALLTAPETRTSSPVRILRNDALESAAVGGLYPCGEGAGYAGGIMSAAVDGIRCATAIMKDFAP